MLLRSAALLFFLAGLASQAEGRPARRHDAAAAFDADACLLLMRLASAAYCPAASLVNWSCERCHSVVPSFHPTHIFEDPSKDLQAFAGFDVSSNMVVLAFRGTDGTSISNWIANLEAYHVDFNFPGYPGARVHAGFYYDYTNKLQGAIQAIVPQLLAQFPNADFAVTGHSLGGALTYVAALEVMNITRALGATRTPIIYTFGSPRVGNDVFAGIIGREIPISYRLTNHNDIVPHVPAEIQGFHHPPQEVWINGENNNLRFCDGSGEDPTCADSVSFIHASVSDHLNYLGVPLNTNCTR